MSFCDHRIMLFVRFLSTICLKQYLLNYWVEFYQTLQEWFLDGPLLKLFKDFNSMKNSGRHKKRKTLKIFMSKTTWPI